MIQSFLSYLQYEKRSSRHTVISYENDLRQFSDFLSSPDINLELIQADHKIIRYWVSSLSEKGIAPRSINRKLASLRAFYRFLHKQNLLEVNPLSKISGLKTEKKLPESIKQSEIEGLLSNENLQSDDQLTAKLIIELLYGTGIRVSELTGILISDIDYQKASIKVLGKRNKERIIPVNNSLLSLINQYLNGDANKGKYLLTGKSGKRFSSRQIYQIVNRILGEENVSVDRKSPHILRHSYATHLLQNGADLNAIKELLGHSSLAATQVYTHASLEKLKEVYRQAHPKA